ncbi:hypothetical protein FB45DRAFT_1029096 [Roridomyces roridus]|uniref:Anaphase-promoting complex subunit 5 domain-containing protein n=1 Tax=Roridomyces roridus TaxID=1738132 RepID=A0AAD7FKH8_9AGAR|nr:hypothetical protein FB45DRAFT_1029096 [Roridomyces roridus]
MALSGRLAVTYLSKLEQPAAKDASSAQNLAEKASSQTNIEAETEDIDIAVALFEKLQKRQLYTFDADLAALLEHKAGVLVACKQVPEALNIALKAAATRLDVARRSGQAPENAIQTLNTCLEKLQNRTAEIQELSDDTLSNIQDAVKFHPSSAHGNTTEPLANSLSCVGVLLRYLDYEEDAMNAHKAASDLRRSLASTDPTVLPHLGQSLHFLASELSHLNHHNEALLYITEAVDIRRQLKDRDSTMARDFAKSLTGLAWDLQAATKYTEAISAITEAVETFRQLSQTDLMTVKGLALALTVFAQLHRTDDLEVTLSARREVVELHKKAASMDPSANELLLADALSKLALQLAGSNHSEEALKIGKEALETIRRFPDTLTRKSEYLAWAYNDLGGSLANLGAMKRPCMLTKKLSSYAANSQRTTVQDTLQIWEDLHKLGQQEEALHIEEEVVAVSRKLSDHYLVSALDKWAQGLRKAGRHKDVVQVDQEIVELARKDSNSMGFQKSLARSLNNLSVDLGRIGNFEEAAKADKEAADILRNLVKESDVTVVKDLARSLSNLAFDLRRLGRHEEAVQADEESAAVYRDRLKEDPTVTQNLASCLDNLGLDFTNLGRHEDALRVDQEAIDIRRKLADTDAMFKRSLAISLNHLSLDLRNLGRDEEALHAREEVVAIRRDLAAKTNTVNTTKDLAQSLSALVLILHAVGRYEEAVQIRREEVVIERQLAETDPAMTNILVGSLSRLASDLRKVGCFQEALHWDEDAVVFCRKLGEADASSSQRVASCIHMVGVDLEIVGRYDEAVETHRQVTAMLRTPPSDDPKLTQLLARSLMSEGYNLFASHHQEDALRCHNEAVEISRALSATDWPRLLPQALINLGTTLCALKKHEASIQAYHEAVELFRKCDGPTAISPQIGLAQSLKLLAVIERVIGSNGTVPVAELEAESDEILSKLLETDPILAVLSFDELALVLRTWEFREDSLLLQRRAVELYRKIKKTNSNCGEAQLRSLRLFAKDLRALGQEQEAVEIESEITELETAVGTAAESSARATGAPNIVTETPSPPAANQAPSDDPKGSVETGTAPGKDSSTTAIGLSTAAETPSASSSPKGPKLSTTGIDNAAAESPSAGASAANPTTSLASSPVSTGIVNPATETAR